MTALQIIRANRADFTRTAIAAVAFMAAYAALWSILP